MRLARSWLSSRSPAATEKTYFWLWQSSWSVSSTLSPEGPRPVWRHAHTSWTSLSWSGPSPPASGEGALPLHMEREGVDERNWMNNYVHTHTHNMYNVLQHQKQQHTIQCAYAIMLDIICCPIVLLLTEFVGKTMNCMYSPRYQYLITNLFTTLWDASTSNFWNDRQWSCSLCAVCHRVWSLMIECSLEVVMCKPIHLACSILIVAS